MSGQDLRTEAQKRAWELLGSVENHPAVQDWLEELDGTTPAHRGDSLPSPVSGRRRWRYSVAASVLLAVAAGIGAYLHFAPTHYETHIGEQRDVLLSDGSRITLNTDTSVEVRYSNTRRFIELKRGEALFSVAHNSRWPFDVSAGGTLTRAIGTEFNVDLRGSRVTVSVLEGAVQVAEANRMAPAGAILGSGDAVSNAQAGFSTIAPALAKGEAIEIRPQERRVIAQKAELRRIDAWRMRHLEFSDTPLPAAVEEFNRYSRTRVVIGSPELDTVRVSGVFQIGDADGFLFSLKEALGVQALESPGEVTLVRTRS
jgi:transmembrane sensor